ncbi:MAG: hypothetical protein AB7D02_01090 [Candidatus Paceibacterota bacterium]
MNDQIFSKFSEFFKDFSSLLEKISQSPLLDQFLKFLKEGGKLLVSILEFFVKWLKNITS